MWDIRTITIIQQDHHQENCRPLAAFMLRFTLRALRSDFAGGWDVVSLLREQKEPRRSGILVRRLL